MTTDALPWPWPSASTREEPASRSPQRGQQAPAKTLVGRFLETIGGASRTPIAWGTGALMNTMPRTSLDDLSTCATAPVQWARRGIVIKAAEDWKRDSEFDYLVGLIEEETGIRHGEKLARRLRSLRRMALEDQDLDLAADSLRTFHEFLSLNPSVRYPEVTLTPDGNFYARWRDTDRSLLSIHFLPAARVRFVLFRPDRRRPAIRTRISGTASVASVMETVAGVSGDGGWIME